MLVLTFAAALAVVVAGCGTGAYDELMDQRAAALRQRAKFLGLCAPTAVENTRFTIDLPNIFKPIKNVPAPLIPLARVSPYQGMEILEPDVEAPYCCFFAPMRSNPLLPASLAAKVKDALPGSAPAWEPVEVDTPVIGEKLPWQVMRVEGIMPFQVFLRGAPEVRRLPGKAELWLYAGPKTSLVLLWQIPTQLEEKVGLMTYAPLTAGTLKILPPPPEPPAPDAAPAGAPAAPAPDAAPPA